MGSLLVRCLGGVGLFASLAPFAQAQRGFELGGDATFTHYTFSRSTGPSPSPMTQLALPISNIRLAVPTETSFEPEFSARLTYSTTAGQSTTAFAGDMGLLWELSHDLDGGWFVRPAIGWQQTQATGTTRTSHATLGAGIGARVGMTDRIASRFEARYTYLTESQGVSANAIGFLAGISVYTRSR